MRFTPKNKPMKKLMIVFAVYAALGWLPAWQSNAAGTTTPAIRKAEYAYRAVTPARKQPAATVAFRKATGAAPVEDTLTLSGKVLDKQTGRPIPYAGVGIRGKPVGTITNEAGMFDSYLPAGSPDDVLFVSCIGYAGFNASVGSLPAGPIVVELEPVTYSLRETVVQARKGLSAKEIVIKAKHSIADNYPTRPYRLEAYFRKSQKVDGKYIHFLDAALDIYDKGYQRAPLSEFQLQEQVVLRETRQSHYHNPKSYDNALDVEWQYYNTVQHLLLQNAVRYRSEALNTRHYDYRMDSVVRQDSSTFYVITALIKHRKFMNWGRQNNTRRPAYQLYIHTGNFAIHRIVYTPVPLPVGRYEEAEDLLAAGDNDSIRSYLLGSEGQIRVEYKPFGGVLYLHYILLQAKVNDYHLRRKKELFSNEYKRELLVNNIHTEDVQPPGAGSVMAEMESLEDQATPYNPSFWKTYNAIKWMPLDEALFANLGVRLPLEKQFAKRVRVPMSQEEAEKRRTRHIKKIPNDSGPETE